jgi:hypothetical protein
MIYGVSIVTFKIKPVIRFIFHTNLNPLNVSTLTNAIFFPGLVFKQSIKTNDNTAY